MDHRIEKTVELRAPVARVWHVLTDENELREWFTGPIRPVQVEHERLLAFRGPSEPTLVELSLQPLDGGTLLNLSESGFERVPIGRRGALFDDSDVLWTERSSPGTQSQIFGPSGPPGAKGLAPPFPLLYTLSSDGRSTGRTSAEREEGRQNRRPATCRKNTVE